MNCCLVDIAIVDAFGRGPCCCCFLGFVLKGIRIQFVVCLAVAVLADVAAGGCMSMLPAWLLLWIVCGLERVRVNSLHFAVAPRHVRQLLMAANSCD